MKIAMFSAKAYDRDHFELANAQFGYKVDYFDVRLDLKTCRLAHGYPVVCAFVNDDLGRDVLTELAT
ncbi:MAG: 2-hydroxyacid dehydrogenase, partial [Aeromonadaceae bacterium]